jgi:ABC-type transporter Mla subunit MlaD
VTDRQEEELFKTLGSLVTGVQQIQRTLDDHTKKLDDHTGKLDHLVSKTDSIAQQVMENDKRLTARIVSVEQAVDNLGGEIH